MSAKWREIKINKIKSFFLFKQQIDFEQKEGEGGVKKMSEKGGGSKTWFSYKRIHFHFYFYSFFLKNYFWHFVVKEIIMFYLRNIIKFIFMLFLNIHSIPHILWKPNINFSENVWKTPSNVNNFDFEFLINLEVWLSYKESIKNKAFVVATIRCLLLLVF